MDEADPEGWIAKADEQISQARLIELCSAMVEIASPPGDELELATDLADRLDDAGFGGVVQPVVGEHGQGGMANAHGVMPGTDSSASSLLLYAPIDTVSVGTEADDLPWIGPELRSDMKPGAEVRDGLVIGLGAHNPKGHGACVFAAAEAIAAAGVPLAGDLLIGFGGGGMPTNARHDGVADAHGAGCAALVDLLAPDQAVISKTGWAVSWEEVGLTWFEVEVAGSHTYVGSRHLLPYSNAIAKAGQIIGGLETWFEAWAAEHADGLVAPQGVVAAIEGGWPHMPAFTTASCRFWVDLRLSPRTTPGKAAAAFGAEVERLAAECDAEVSWRQTVAIPGTTTDPDAAVIGSSIRAWESLTGRTHESIPGLSGATDANILRAKGVPTARVGLPKVNRPDLGTEFANPDFQLGMNAVDVNDMEQLTKLLIRIAIDTCGIGDPS